MTRGMAASGFGWLTHRDEGSVFIDRRIARFSR